MITFKIYSAGGGTVCAFKIYIEVFSQTHSQRFFFLRQGNCSLKAIIEYFIIRITIYFPKPYSIF